MFFTSFSFLKLEQIKYRSEFAGREEFGFKIQTEMEIPFNTFKIEDNSKTYTLSENLTATPLGQKYQHHLIYLILIILYEKL